MTDEDIKALENTELCVCHLQSDCPTHPKGDFGVMTDTEINKACAELMGKKWYASEVIWSDISKGKWRCKTCDTEWYGWDGFTEIICKENPDPLNNKSDWEELIIFCVNRWDEKELEAFILSVQQDEPEYNEYSFPRHLLKDMRALPTAVAEYQKEGK